MSTTNGHLQDGHMVDLPVINISESTAEVGRQMIDAAAKYGFLYIDSRGTEFTPEVVERQFELSKQFFSSSEAEKASCKIGPDNRGWSGMHSETLDPAHQKRGDFKEAFNIGEFINNSPQQPMPTSLTDHQSEILDFETRCRKTCRRILDLLALGLEISDPKWFSTRHKTPSGCILRYLHYPALPADADYKPEVDIRAGAHSDYGSITLLFQRPSQPGLEILTSNPPSSDPSQMNWSPVPVIPPGYNPQFFTTHQTPPPEPTPPLPPILLNIGDLLSYWTNGLLRSTVHRVIFPHQTTHPSPTPAPTMLGQDRYSIAYFCHPTDDTKLEAVPSRLVREVGLEVGYGGGAGAGAGAGEKVLTAKQHLKRRLEATYGFVHV